MKKTEMRKSYNKAMASLNYFPENKKKVSELAMQKGVRVYEIIEEAIASDKKFSRWARSNKKVIEKSAYIYDAFVVFCNENDLIHYKALRKLFPR